MRLRVDAPTRPRPASSGSAHRERRAIASGRSDAITPCPRVSASASPAAPCRYAPSDAAIAGLRAGAGLVTLAGPSGGGELAAPDPIMTAALDDADGLAALLAGKQALSLIHISEPTRPY